MADGAYGGRLLGRIRERMDGLPLVTPQFISDARESVPHHPEDARPPARRFEVRDSYIEIEAGSRDGARLATQYPMSISEVLAMSARHRRGPLPPAADTAARGADRVERLWTAEISEEWLSQDSPPRMTTMRAYPTPDTAARAAFDRGQVEAANREAASMAAMISRCGVTIDEALAALEQAALSLAGSPGEPPRIAPEAQERARALLRGLLTSGERRVFKKFGYVPVIGSGSRDLWLVTGKPAYNLIRYERAPRGFPGAPENLSKPFPVTWCAAAATPAPVEDLTFSLIIALRSDESRVIEIANRLYPAGGFPYGDGYRRLRELAKSQCGNKKLLRSHLRRARKAERPQPGNVYAYL